MVLKKLLIGLKKIHLYMDNNISSKLKRFISKLTPEQKKLRRRILEISHEAHASHIGSCFTSVDIINAVYKIKKPSDKFVLSSGHAGVALYVVLEINGIMKNPSLKKLHVHPDLDMKNGIEASSGSLGQGLPIAVGMALAQRNKNVYCLISDGECYEGSIWESINIASIYKLGNLKILVNANGYGAYGKIDLKKLGGKFKSFGANVLRVNGHDVLKIKKLVSMKTENKPSVIITSTLIEQLPFLKGQHAHYKIMTGDEYNLGKKILT